MYSLSSTTQESTSTCPDEESTISSVSVLEVGIGGCRFGVVSDCVVETFFWQPVLLAPPPHTIPGVAGTIISSGQVITVLAPNELFVLEDPTELETATMLVTVQPHDQPFGLLVDGLIGIHEVPKDVIRSFVSLYVSGVKWLRGAAIFNDRVISLLDLEALERLSLRNN